MRLLKIAFYYIPRLIIEYIFWIARYAKHPEKYLLNKRYKKARDLIISGTKSLNMDILIEGKENIPNGVCCYYSNHLGACDPLAFFKALETPVSFVGKVEVKKMPIVGKLFSATEGLFLDRDDLKQQLKVMLKVEKNLREGVTSYVIYPEGTRNKDQMALMREFHHGTFRAAMKAKVPLVPVVEFGSFRVLDFKHNHKSYPTYIKFLPAIYPEEYEGKSTEEVAKMIQSIIQKEIAFNARPLDHKRMLALGYKHYRFNKIY